MNCLPENENLNNQDWRYTTRLTIQLHTNYKVPTYIIQRDIEAGICFWESEST